jgi:hypothetical protein
VECARGRENPDHWVGLGITTRLSTARPLIPMTYLGVDFLGLRESQAGSTSLRSISLNQAMTSIRMVPR